MGVILSSPIMVCNGTYSRYTLDKTQALAWVKENEPVVFSAHQTVKVLGLEPAKGRETCHGYSEALILQPKGRLEFGREYSVEEIEAVGLNYILIVYEGEL